MNPIISLIAPAYNVEKYIDTLIILLCSQIYEYNR